MTTGVFSDEREIYSDFVSELVFFYGSHFLHLYRVLFQHHGFARPCCCYVIYAMLKILLGTSSVLFPHVDLNPPVACKHIVQCHITVRFGLHCIFACFCNAESA